MEKNKISQLARSFSTSCQKLVEENQMLRKVISPTVTLVAITVVKSMLLEVGIDKKPFWSG
jgi:hypothetical protein